MNYDVRDGLALACLTTAAPEQSAYQRRISVCFCARSFPKTSGIQGIINDSLDTRGRGHDNRGVGSLRVLSKIPEASDALSLSQRRARQGMRSSMPMRGAGGKYANGMSIALRAVVAVLCAALALTGCVGQRDLPLQTGADPRHAGRSEDRIKRGGGDKCLRRDPSRSGHLPQDQGTSAIRRSQGRPAPADCAVDSHPARDRPVADFPRLGRGRSGRGSRRQVLRP